LAVANKYDTSSAVARTSSGDAVVNVSVVPTIANAPAGSTSVVIADAVAPNGDVGAFAPAHRLA
jgi:hypothetical protein